jgi:hypothetical protein
VVHDSDQAVLIAIHQIGEGFGIVGIADAQHQADVGIAQRHLRAALSDSTHVSLVR